MMGYDWWFSMRHVRCRGARLRNDCSALTLDELRIHNPSLFLGKFDERNKQRSQWQLSLKRGSEFLSQPLEEQSTP
jgi:hypothetical protein